MAWNSGDNGGTWAPSGSLSSSISFKRGTSTLASVTITGTINTSTGYVTLSSSSATGSPSVNFTNNGSASALATITKSGAETAVSGIAINLGDLGK